MPWSAFLRNSEQKPTPSLRSLELSSTDQESFDTSQRPYLPWPSSDLNQAQRITFNPIKPSKPSTDSRSDLIKAGGSGEKGARQRPDGVFYETDAHAHIKRPSRHSSSPPQKSLSSMTPIYLKSGNQRQFASTYSQTQSSDSSMSKSPHPQSSLSKRPLGDPTLNLSSFCLPLEPEDSSSTFKTRVSTCPPTPELSLPQHFQLPQVALSDSYKLNIFKTSPEVDDDQLPRNLSISRTASNTSSGTARSRSCNKKSQKQSYNQAEGESVNFTRVNSRRQSKLCIDVQIEAPLKQSTCVPTLSQFTSSSSMSSKNDRLHRFSSSDVKSLASPDSPTRRHKQLETLFKLEGKDEANPPPIVQAKSPNPRDTKAIRLSAPFIDWENDEDSSDSEGTASPDLTTRALPQDQDTTVSLHRSRSMSTRGPVPSRKSDPPHSWIESITWLDATEHLPTETDARISYNPWSSIELDLQNYTVSGASAQKPRKNIIPFQSPMPSPTHTGGFRVSGPPPGPPHPSIARLSLASNHSLRTVSTRHSSLVFAGRPRLLSGASLGEAASIIAGLDRRTSLDSLEMNGDFDEEETAEVTFVEDLKSESKSKNEGLADLLLKHERVISTAPFLASKNSRAESPGSMRSRYTPLGHKKSIKSKASTLRFSTFSALCQYKFKLDEVPLTPLASSHTAREAQGISPRSKCQPSTSTPSPSLVDQARLQKKADRRGRENAYKATFLSIYGSDLED